MRCVDIKEFDPNKMELNEVIVVEGSSSLFGLQVMKVPNGWVYTNYHLGKSVLSSVFVPDTKAGFSEGAK